MSSDTFILKAVKTPAEKNRESSQNPDFIFSDKSLHHYEESLLKGIELIQKSMSAADKPFSGILPHELAAQFHAIDLNRSCNDLNDALAEIEELYLNHAIYFHHPHYVAHLNCPVAIPAILAELLLTSINSSVDTWDQSAGGTLIEQKLIDWTAERIGLGCYVIQSQCMKTGKAKTYRAKKLVLGTGTLPYTPACCRETAEKSVHSSQYLRHKKTLQRKKSITVLGSGQSAAEIVYDLLQDIDSYGYELSWITRSPRFYPLEYSKLTLEMASPEYVDYFYQLPAHKRERLIADQKNLYKGINGSLINDIYDLMYVKRLSHDFRVNLLTNSELKAAEFNADDGHFDLEFFQNEQETGYSHRSEGLVLATGYRYQLPAFIDGIASRIQWDQQDRSRSTETTVSIITQARYSCRMWGCIRTASSRRIWVWSAIAMLALSKPSPAKNTIR
ncbi:SidA/IucD/PvdA family monooxygenase [Methylobacter sp.]|uniref:SidA/IucD/PvdA family monooxygenase n=1 Tax=Methylobacter sp. TaxID=2051955 RepID=UPI002489FD9B|nr:SidA/IucD/PvdA family monooxygenase [Methylobacter sp.]MDI1279313.1 SidA/IucD/PvdA family monooxygenase [Methylobacter sp.]MDI1360085.1 SidA/IucD/PvdA family monooxygenase [Methylobacter sp.]